jgi:hypothetical protein
MEIARERFLAAGRDYHLTLALRSRTGPMHSALTALTADERAEVGLALARALDDIERVLRPHLPEHSAPAVAPPVIEAEPVFEEPKP